MRRGLYQRLAADNIKRNSQTYIPYILTCAITAAMTYIIRSLAVNDGLEQMRGGYALKDILSLGSHITRIFGFIFLFYTNSFLMKRRKKEFGLLNILGMEKRHIAKMLLFETLYTAAISLAAGFGLGILLDKLLFLTLTKMLDGDVQLGFYISADSIAVISLFMLATFAMIYLNSLRQIHLSNPIELLHGSKMGEKEPRAKWFMAILGIALVGTGYYISIVTTQPMKALMLFFVAVLCVILGTYLLFAAGSIALLKLLKRNKSYYYKTAHFTTVSGMIYRMKQNAVGLANICILSTMVLVMISATSCLLAGLDDIINTRYPYDFSVRSTDASVSQKAEEYLSDNNIDVKKDKKYSSLTFGVIHEENDFYIPDEYFLDMDDLCEFGVIDLADYNRLTDNNIQLPDDGVLLWSNSKKLLFDRLDVLGEEYTVTEQIDDFPISATMSAVDCVCIVVKDKSVMQELYEKQKSAYGDSASEIQNYYHFDADTSDKDQLYYELRSFLLHSGISDYSVDAKHDSRADAMSLYGGLFFLGAFLGILFLMQTILIIYYKQISEGFDDKERFEIMQKVGMSRAEVKRSIHSQIITVFFLPLITAGIHTGFAFPLIRRLMLMFSMTNTRLFILCLILCFAVFTVIYGLIYSVTARTYYRIVSK